MWKALQNVLLPPASCEEDAEFREVLTNAARKGMQAAAVLGVVVVVLFVLVKVAVLGNRPAWAYGEDVIVLWDKLLIIAIAVAALTSGGRLSLNGIRVLAAILIVAAALASVADDIAGGDTSFSQGYVGFIYLLAVTAVPYRPLHTVVLGLALGGTLYAAIEVLPLVMSTETIVHINAHYVYLGCMTVLLTGMSGFLYTMRYAQYRERRKSEELREKVEDLEAAKSHFFVNLSHEFRTPLTLIRAPLDDVLAGRYGDIGHRLSERLGEMRRQAKTLSTLIDQLLDLARLKDGAMPLHAQEYDFVMIVRCQVHVFQSAMEDKAISLRLDFPEAPMHVWCDRERIERVLTNLLSNAWKYTPAGGTIRVRVSLEEQGESTAAVLSIRDSGEGISPDVISVVFDRFAGDGLARGGQASTGIGLSIAKEIVTRHGGSMDVESEAGLGTTFTVRLPLGRDHLAPEDVSSAIMQEPHQIDPGSRPDVPLEFLIDDLALDADPPEHPSDAPRVLIVDDNAAVRMYLRDLLITRYRVEQAADAEEGWERIRAELPALVISDVRMPGGGGFELCRKIRRDERSAAVPVVLLTALAEHESRLEGLAYGADAYIAKPFSSDELLLIAENLIEVRRTLRDRVKLPGWMPSDAPTIPSREAEFLERVQRVVDDHLGDPGFGVEWLAEEVGLSPRQLQRRMKELTQLTAAGFIKAMRLERAARLLAGSDLQVQEVADAVGYRDVSYFSKVFRQIHGAPPSEFAETGTSDGLDGQNTASSGAGARPI